MKNSILLNALVALVFTSCSTLQFTGNPIGQLAVPSTEIIDWEQVNAWQHADIKSENFPGMSVRRVYDEILQDKEGKTVVVAVIDTGIDIKHEMRVLSRRCGPSAPRGSTARCVAQWCAAAAWRGTAGLAARMVTRAI